LAVGVKNKHTMSLYSTAENRVRVRVRVRVTCTAYVGWGNAVKKILCCVRLIRYIRLLSVVLH